MLVLDILISYYVEYQLKKSISIGLDGSGEADSREVLLTNPPRPPPPN